MRSVSGFVMLMLLLFSVSVTVSAGSPEQPKSVFISENALSMETITWAKEEVRPLPSKILTQVELIAIEPERFSIRAEPPTTIWAKWYEVFYPGLSNRFTSNYNSKRGGDSGDIRR